MFVEAGVTKRRSVLESLVDRCRSAKARWNEMQRLDSRKIEAIARELDLSNSGPGGLIFKPSSSLQSLSKGLSHAGLCEGHLAAARGDMRRVCGQCQSSGRCARDRKHERRATPQKYCPNEQTLRALADDLREGACRVLPFPAAHN